MKFKICSILGIMLMTAACKKAEDKSIDVIPVEDTSVMVTEDAPAVPVDSVTAMKSWEAYATPGDAHKMLALDDGTWDEESTMYMTPDDPKPMKTKMIGVSKMILGGRYQEMTHTGMIMGQQFEGIGTMGYNNASKKIESSWIDNMGTAIMRMTGDYDPSSKKIELKGMAVDPVTGKEKGVRETYEIIDDNTRKVEMFDTAPGGKEFKSMEITMKRRK